MQTEFSNYAIENNVKLMLQVSYSLAQPVFNISKNVLPFITHRHGSNLERKERKSDERYEKEISKVTFHFMANVYFLIFMWGRGKYGGGATVTLP